jgi:hypothetical protein
MDFRRVGWNLDVWGEGAWRSDWGPWGHRDSLPFSSAETFEDARTYLRYGLTFGKNWKLPAFQSVGFRLELMQGEDLDRFSRFRVSSFSIPLGGFDGSGLKWDQGGILRLNYQWSLMELAGMNVRLDWARLKHDALGDTFYDTQGLALGGSFTGPKGTMLSFDIGYGLNSEMYPAAEGNVTFQFLVLKLL